MIKKGKRKEAEGSGIKTELEKVLLNSFLCGDQAIRGKKGEKK